MVKYLVPDALVRAVHFVVFDAVVLMIQGNHEKLDMVNS